MSASSFAQPKVRAPVTQVRRKAAQSAEDAPRNLQMVVPLPAIHALAYGGADYARIPLTAAPGHMAFAEAERPRAVGDDMGRAGVLGGVIGGVVGGVVGAGIGLVVGGPIGAVVGGVVGGGIGAGVGALAGSTATPTLSLSNDNYSDSGNTSVKTIGFDVAVPAGLTATDYCLVNKLQGSMKKADGSFQKVMMYGSAVDFNFASEQVDSVDPDPVYWSDSSARWRYNVVSGGFKATDGPGPPGKAFAAGDVAAVKFHIGLYKLADVPTTTTGSISTSPIQELAWQYSVSSDAAGTLTHPAL